MEHRYFLVYKPANMVSQFVSPHPVRLLGALNYAFPEGTHAVGRLDGDSEGLLILTTQKKVTRLLFQSEVPHRRTYLVLVKGQPGPEALRHLAMGVDIRVKGGQTYRTAPCEVEVLPAPPAGYLPNNVPAPVAPGTWLRLTLTEGKFRQVRKMVAALGYPCRRLIRVAIDGLELAGMQPGEVREVPETEFFRYLNLSECTPSL
ncbi:23S rRNA pseudouridine2457 synthase [Rhabdobacter roseus]|uniref:Pseudouridine synthase n=1 Tax=Rhabdobacter roseus TaxID=1655419 RepID=A0A840TWJ1_9BACT|nr:pseudouridine synthase [Rhabdobacter roseus]MBB5287295.1 23S rRNA pseudouridine2457 synthase [Rhabdobacter roseus]